MKDLQREILNQVAAGTISAEEAAARLEALDSSPPGPGESAPAAEPPRASTAAAAAHRVKVTSTLGSAEIVGDPSVAVAVADGPHRARQDGDTLVIEQTPLNESDSFAFSHGESRRVVITGLDWQRRKLTVRMNPDLPLFVNIQGGNARVDGVHGPISTEVQAGNCRIDDFRGPLTLVVQAGNVHADGRLDGGASTVRCEMGSVRVGLARGSNVKVSARATMGKVAIEGHGGALGSGGKDVTIGSGAGTLDIDCTMGNVKVAVE